MAVTNFDFRFSIREKNKCTRNFTLLVVVSPRSDNPKSKIAKAKMSGAVSCPRYRIRRIGGRVAGSQPAKIPRIGFLSAVSPSTISARVEAFKQGLRELGYQEGANNIVIEWRFADGKLDRLPALAAELAPLKVDVIVSSRSNSNPSSQGSNLIHSNCDGR